ncbi:MAG TPA: IclR family transcriptional regulator C-terminal domain-containing protein [Victivallales bacterium]|nr:IclR family transcriptional regulator C-terminal domain-containing protein [Victivallales bacterium]
MLPKQPNQSLIDGLECISFLASAGRPIGSRELARELNFEPTRVHRILKTLSHLGICAQNQNGKYLPGPGMQVLAVQSIFASNSIKKALVYIGELRKYKMISAIGVLWRDKVSYLYHNYPDLSFEESIGRVSLYPATNSAIGMVLLALKSDRDIITLFSGKKIPGYSGGIKSLLNEISKIRINGWAKIPQENGVLSLAVPVDNANFAIALSGKIKRSEIMKYIKILQNTAEKIKRENKNDQKS